ncbi:hypothetical protein K1719_024386 [Acacia pycnantha]|nr:hypothetical protein K1719_024386 [Acacia pycnantha]
MTAPARSISISGDPFVSISKPLSLPLPFNSSYMELHGATLRASRKEDIEKILDWESSYVKQVEIPFKHARVLLQDFIRVPVVVDLACMRDAMKELGSDSNKINPLVPVDLVIDHSVQVDVKSQRMQCRPIWSLSSKETRKDLHFLNGVKCFPQSATCLLFLLVLVVMIEAYLRENLDDVESCISGPKRLNRRILTRDMQLRKELEELKQKYKKLKEEHDSFRDLADRMIQEKDNEISRLLDDNNILHQSQQSSPSVSYLYLLF